MIANMSPLSGKGVGDQVFSRYGVATVVMELLEVGGFNVDGGVELTFVSSNIDIRKVTWD